MKTSTIRGRLLASSMFGAAAIAAMAASPALAQGEAEVEEIVVTGSRIPQPNMTSVSPIQVTTAQDVVLGGRPVTADILNQLPQVTQNSSTGLSSTSNPLSGPGGVATVNLRGLGVVRTLVLVDGRRLGVGDPNTGNTNPAPDLNQIPSQLIERVEVLTGGASAVYGSDAVAGVVNFVMKRNFEGVQIDGRFGVYQHKQQNEFVRGLYALRQIKAPKSSVWDGEARDVSLILGANAPDGRGNVTAYFNFHDQEPVRQSERDYSACQIVTTAAGIASCAGSTNSNLFQLAAGGPQFAVVGNNFAPWNGTATTTPPPFFNSNAYAYLLHQSTRYSAGYMAEYEINKHAEVYSDFMFMHDRSKTEIAPSGLFLGSNYPVNCNNPFLSAQQQGAIGCTPAEIASGASKTLFIGRRNIEGGGREAFHEHQNYRAVFGVRGEVVDSWKYDLYGSYYYTSLFLANSNYLSIARARNALQVVQGPGGPVCISGGSCVPYNIFRDGGVTSAALTYLDIAGTNRGSTTQRIIEGNVTGDLGDYGLKSPMADDGVGVAFGFHYRRDHLEFDPDAAARSGDISGGGGASTLIDNSLSVKEFYAEARIPLIQGQSLADELSAELGFRRSDYSTDVKANTYKLGLSYAPVDDIRFRGSYQKAIRAPNIIELFGPTTITQTSQVGNDPCAAGNLAPATLAQCQRTGITAAQYLTIPNCISSQCAVLQGGNPALAPEKAKTFSVGFTTTPGFIRGFTASVDYYQVKMRGKVDSIPLGITLSRCLNTGDPVYCNQIRRGPSGILFGSDPVSAGYINGASTNIGAGTTSGVDFQLSYNLPMEDLGLDNAGRVTLSLMGAYLIKSTEVSLPGDRAYDCAGLFGPQCEGPFHKWRHTLRANWATPWDVTLSAAWRFYEEVKLERDTNEPSIGLGTVNGFNHTIPQRSYLDLSGTWNVNDMFTLRAGINNVLDQDPPLINSALVGTGLPNSYSTYDLLGRQMFMGFTANF